MELSHTVGLSCPALLLRLLTSNYLLKVWNIVSCHVVQGDGKSNQLTFMLPSLLARSMTRNFLMRSLGEKETVSESKAVPCEKCSLTLSFPHKEKLSEGPLQNCQNDKCILHKSALTACKRWWGLAKWVVSFWQSFNWRKWAPFPAVRTFSETINSETWCTHPWDVSMRMIHRGLWVAECRFSDEMW